MSTRMSTDMNLTKPSSRVSRPPGGAQTFSFSSDDSHVKASPAKPARAVEVIPEPVAVAEPAPVVEKKVVKGKVGIAIAGNVANDFIAATITKALVKEGISGTVVGNVDEVAVLPYAAQNLAKSCDVVIAAAFITSDPTGAVTSSLTSAIVQLGTSGKAPMIPAILYQESLLEAKAVLPTHAESWAKAAAGILNLKNDLEVAPAPDVVIKETPVLTPTVSDPNTLLDIFRESLKSHGARGIVGLSRKFKIADDNNNGIIDLAEFTKVVKEHALSWSAAQIKSVFDFFDSDKSGGISIDEFLVGVRGELNERRKQLVLQAFAILDADKSGLIELNDIMAKYDASKHPDVKTGKRTKESVLSEFLDTFDSIDKDGKVTPLEFCKYYSNVSSSIDEDDYFELMIRNAWHISGGEGWCANSSCRRVLVTHKDGHQSVEEIKNDLGIKADDKAAMMANLVAQGLTDIVSIDTSGSTSGPSEPNSAEAPPSPKKNNQAAAGFRSASAGGEQANRPGKAAAASNFRRQVGGASSFTLG